MYKHRITVFTPTYNRAYILEKLYRSLCRQSFTDFEWIVINDGSSDNTDQLFEKWIREDKEFTINYVVQENMGSLCKFIDFISREMDGDE